MPEANETALEQTFSDLAYSHLRDQSQALLDYLVGFQMLKQEEDGQRAVGIFGFEIGGDYYYAPVFFLNGEIRGLDSLYSVKSDLFVPLTDGWVSSIIDQREVKLGDPDSRSRAQRGIHVPNYTRLKVIPGGGGTTNLKLAEVMAGDRDHSVSVDLVHELSQAGAAGLFKRALDERPELRQQFDQWYNYMDLVDREVPQAKTAQEKAVVVINQITDEGVDRLTDEQRQTVLEGGAVVLDDRPEVGQSQIFRTETKNRLSNPDGGGLYDVLWGDGSVSVGLVAPSNTLKDCLFVYRDEDDKYCEIKNDCVYVLRKYGRQELVDWLDSKGMKPSQVRPGSVVTFISDDGEGTAAFCVDENNTGLDNITSLRVEDRHYCSASPFFYGGDERGDNGNPPHNAFMDLRIGGDGDSEIPNRSNRPGDPNCRVRHILVTDAGAGAPRYTSKQLLVNDKCFWALKVNSFRLREIDQESYPREVELYNEPDYDAHLCVSDFGNENTLCQSLDKVAQDLRVWRQNGETTVKLGSARTTFRGEAQGLRLLVQGLECGEDDARAVLKEAHLKPTTWKLRPNMKIAAELLELPDMEDTDLGGFLTSFHRQQVPFTTANQARSAQNREFYQYYSPFGGGGDEGDQGPGTFDAVESAGKTGQKDVFDASALGSLIKSHNPTDLVDRFLPTITSGMDRVGRMLFLIYWHYEDFEERYGDNDLSEFIDNLRTVFEQMGDVVIFAKKRTLAGDPEHFGMGAAPIIEESV